MAYGVLETLYNKDISVDEGVKLALKAINSALQRDIASGNGIEILTISKSGVKRVVDKELASEVIEKDSGVKWHRMTIPQNGNY